MGTVIRLPEAERPRVRKAFDAGSASATVIILPVIRIERYDDEPTAAVTSRSQRRRRRRRSSRN